MSGTIIVGTEKKNSSIESKKKKNEKQQVKQQQSLRDWLFAWELIAAFSPPRTVCILHTLCRDVRSTLQHSSTGTRLLQRYWNAQYHRLVWGDEVKVGDEQKNKARRTLEFTLSRSEGKRDWMKMYREEYPSWCARTFLGVGTRNNDVNVAKVLFKVEPPNEALPGEEIAKMELTPEEALARRVEKNLQNLEGEEVENCSGSGSRNRSRGKGNSHPQIVDKKGRRKGDRTDRQKVMKNPALGLSRDDYKNDQRLGKHKEKHKKGRMGRWDGLAGDGCADDNDW
ncbi:uncharacterized protein TM35_000132880 [Trypanosoma theileri]|uniref:Uncharacterized protein n=1 Tax=Trypanosoma theileri TaxID=67003 RepID=A0A1X0NX54_9TRYP|nr:uncharacterized protein TM35_000132880 [Trypanosoma theileri]ORC89284.1 hypothetical protein TM35_000132880 [Trypanosoma theileri]